MSDLMLALVFVMVALTVVGMMRRSQSAAQKPTTQSSPTGSSTGSAKTSQQQQIAEDIRLTQTLDMVDAIQIMDELSETTHGFRQYCELVGTSMPSGGITAPYSQRKVAYYDVKCYRIDRERGRDIETLVAHETSPDAFWFNDGSCEEHVFVDLDTFGSNTILVNTANHIEGPGSDFAQAFAKKASATRTSTTGGAYAMVGELVSRGASAVRDAGEALGDALRPRWSPQMALIGGGTASMDEAFSFGTAPAHVHFAEPRGTDSRGPHPRTSGRDRDRDDDDDRKRDRDRDDDRRPYVSSYTVRPGHGYPHPRPTGGMPGGLGDFLGGSYGGGWVMGGGMGNVGYPQHHRPSHGSDTTAGMILGMGLGALLSSLNETATASTTTGGSNSSFQGYRIVENVVPLASPIYCIGEIYRIGSDVHMGASHAKDYPTSYFATKPESEVLGALER